MSSHEPRPAPAIRDRGLLATGVVAVLVTVGYAAGPLPGPAWTVLTWPALTLVQAVAVKLCLDVAGLPTTGRAVARFYRVIAVAAGLFAAASVVQTVVVVRDPGRPDAVTGSPVHVALLAAGAVLLIVAMLTSPLGLTSRRERTRFWLDAAVVMIGVGLFAWHLGGAGDLVAALVGPAAFVVVAFGLVKISLGGSAVFTRSAGLLGCAGAVLEGVNKAAAQPLLATGRVSWVLGLGILANLAFVAGLRLNYAQARRGPAVARTGDRRRHSRLPYAGVGASYALLIWVLLGSPLGLHAWVVLGGAIVSSALVVARQLAAFADNDDLLARLDAKVTELAEAKEVLQDALAERDALAARLRHLAYHDSLTGLANRALFLETLTAALGTGRTTVAILDLDDFKPVNDTYGHHAGDALLRAVAGRMTSCVPAGGSVARLGGDEFAVLVEGPVDVAALVRRLADAVAEPVDVGPASVRVRASIGTATAGPGSDVCTLLHEADLGMYADKRLKI